MFVAQPGNLVMGVVITLVGVSVILLRRVLGEYAYQRGLALGNKRRGRTIAYWIGLSWLVGGFWLFVGIVMAIVSMRFE